MWKTAAGFQQGWRGCWISGLYIIGSGPSSLFIVWVLSWYTKPPGPPLAVVGVAVYNLSLLPINFMHLIWVLPLLTAGHSLTPGPFCVPFDDGLMSSLFVRCTPICSCRTESDTPHLPTVVGVYGPSGAPKSDRGCGEAGNKCRPPGWSGFYLP